MSNPMITALLFFVLLLCISIQTWTSWSKSGHLIVVNLFNTISTFSLFYDHPSISDNRVVCSSHFWAIFQLIFQNGPQNKLKMIMLEKLNPFLSSTKMIIFPFIFPSHFCCSFKLCSDAYLCYKFSPCFINSQATSICFIYLYSFLLSIIPWPFQYMQHSCCLLTLFFTVSLYAAYVLLSPLFPYMFHLSCSLMQ